MTCPNCKKPDDVKGGYKNGNDITWCIHCGQIRWCSDGLVSGPDARRDDHAGFCEKTFGLVAFGCASEAEHTPASLGSGKPCKKWCGHHYCATAPNLKYIEPGDIEYASWANRPAATPSVGLNHGE